MHETLPGRERRERVISEVFAGNISGRARELHHRAGREQLEEPPRRMREQRAAAERDARAAAIDLRLGTAALVDVAKTGRPAREHAPRAERLHGEHLEPAEPRELALPTDGDSVTSMRRIGWVRLPAPFDATLDVWWLHQYGGGLFLPVRDGTAGTTSYGGGRYLLDTAKGADLGGEGDRLVVDLNFLYHPSCRYDPAWQCPLAQPGNTIAPEIRAGERYGGAKISPHRVERDPNRLGHAPP